MKAREAPELVDYPVEGEAEVTSRRRENQDVRQQTAKSRLMGRSMERTAALTARVVSTGTRGRKN